VNSSDSVEYLYDLGGNEMAAVVPGTSNLYTSELFDNGRHWVTFNGAAQFLHTDWLGTVRAVTNLSGSINQQCTGLPFGDALSCTSGITNYQGISGSFLDSYDNLDHFLYRQYTGNEGRWVTPDPAGLAAVDPSNPQSWNRYAYVMNNPVSFTDPTGLDCVYVNDDSSVGVMSGDCASPTDDGYYVNGTVDTSSLTYNSDTQSLGFSYTTDDGVFGVGTIAGVDWSGGDNGSPYGGGADAANNGSWWSALTHSPWVVSWILPLAPVPGVAGVGPAGSIAWNPATKTLCGSLGAGASVGDNLAAGPVIGRTLNGQQATPSQINQVFSGWSANFGFNVPIGPVPVGPGVQVSANGSGVVYGPTVGVAGASASSTYAVCASF
jgi:RHS repeat-associated protein